MSQDTNVSQLILFEHINIIIIHTIFKCSSQFTVFENINMIMIIVQLGARRILGADPLPSA